MASTKQYQKKIKHIVAVSAWVSKILTALASKHQRALRNKRERCTLACLSYQNEIKTIDLVMNDITQIKERI